MMDADYLYLPPGFRFHPTDEEIITHYLLEKIVDRNFSPVAIGEANFNDCEPWDLPSKAKMGEKEWYFFCEKDRKYPTGMRTNRATESGYWKATGKDKEISKGKRVLIGMKKTLVFYKGRAPKGQKTNWVMHEYRLEGKHHENYNLSISPKGKWVVCKVRHKLKDTKMNPAQELAARMNTFVDALFVENPAYPPLLDSPYFNSINKGVEGSHCMENEFRKSNFSSQTDTLIPCFLNQEGETMRAPLFSNQAASAMRGPCKLEQSSNSIVSASQDTGLSTERNTEASSAVSKHQISTLHSYDDDSSSGVEALDFGSILKYEFE